MKLDTRRLFGLAQRQAGWRLFVRAALAATAGSTALLVSLSDIGRTPHRRLATMAVTLAAIAANCLFVARVGSGSPADNVLVVACAFAAAALGGEAPGLASAARFAAMAALSAVGLHAGQPGVLAAVLAGGTWAIGLTWAAARLSTGAAGGDVLDWREGPRAALVGVRSGWRFGVCAAAAAAASIGIGHLLPMTRAYWATLTVVMVMQREGRVSLRLLLHYIAGTLLGVLAAELLWKAGGAPPGVALAATLAAALTRLGFGLAPALGVAGFTAFVVLIIDLAHRPFGDPTPLLAARLVDVGIGALLALLATLLAVAWRRAAERPGSGIR